MTARLKHSEFVPFAPPNCGETIHIHHCKEGRNNDRLYISRKEDGTIVAFCHHCNKAGFSSKTHSRGPIYRRLDTRSGSGTEGEERAEEKVRRRISTNHLFASPSTFSPESLLWLYKAGLTRRAVEKYEIQFNPYTRRVFLPFYSDDGSTIEWFQERKVEEVEGPKYSNPGAVGRKALFTVDRNRVEVVSNHKVCVVVEDLLSGIRVAQQFCPVKVMGGHHLKTDTLMELEGQDNICFFFDKDARRDALDAARRARTLFPRASITVVKNSKDPKEYSDKELFDIITRGHE